VEKDSTGLDLVRFVGDPGWRRRWGHFRRIVADEVRSPSRGGRRRRSGHDAAVEAIYRQLRVGLEASKAAPAAADFYIGELEARRRRAQWLSVDHWLLPLYRWAGGYGVRAAPPLVSLAVVVAGTAAVADRFETAFVTADVEDGETIVGGYRLDDYWQSLAFVARNSISLFTVPSSDELSAFATFLLIGERLTAVSLLALFVFALRSRVAR
jgi:hypothetical protein